VANVPDVEQLIRHWKKQVRILVDAGVPLEPIAASLRSVALDVENDWFCSVVEGLAAKGQEEREPN
jgi:hypothetical protein